MSYHCLNPSFLFYKHAAAAVNKSDIEFIFHHQLEGHKDVDKTYKRGK